MKKLIKAILIILAILLLVFLVLKSIFNVSVDEDDLPDNVYNENGNLLTVLNGNLFDIFLSPLQTDDYTLVEDITNLVIRDSIQKNINEEYDPLGTCETDECNFIVSEDNYYVNYVWTELTEDNQLLVNVSAGTNKVGGFNTIAHLYFDIEIEYLSFEIVLTLDEIMLNETEISVELLDKILSNFDKDGIEESVTEGTLDLEEYTYQIEFISFP